MHLTIIMNAPYQPRLPSGTGGVKTARRVCGLQEVPPPDKTHLLVWKQTPVNLFFPGFVQIPFPARAFFIHIVMYGVFLIVVLVVFLGAPETGC